MSTYFMSSNPHMKRGPYTYLLLHSLHTAYNLIFPRFESKSLFVCLLVYSLNWDFDKNWMLNNLQLFSWIGFCFVLNLFLSHSTYK